MKTERQHKGISRHLQTSVTDDQVPACRSVLLQGRTESATNHAFLFPDGSGSASSYAKIGRLRNPGLALIGLNSPYVLHPTEMNCSLDQLISSYITEIRRRQPTGPYNLGGWSVGGILAFYAASVLIQEEEEVERLLLIDSPAPTHGLEKLPQHFFDHCSKHGLWGKENILLDGPGSRTAQNFNATMDLLSDFRAEPLPLGVIPKVSMIWAEETALDGVKMPKLSSNQNEVSQMRFLTEPRTDFSAGAWSELFHGEDCQIMKAEGLDHFNMMRDDSNVVAKFIDRAFSDTRPSNGNALAPT